MMKNLLSKRIIKSSLLGIIMAVVFAVSFALASIPLGSNFQLNSQLPLDARTVVADLVARDAIPAGQRYRGLAVYVLSTAKNYQLQAGITNPDWVEISTIASLSGYIPYTGGTSNVDLGIHNLTVDTNSLFVDSVNHRVGIGNIIPAQALDVTGSIALPTTVDTTSGVIYKGATSFIHNFALPGTDGFNTFVGMDAGNFTMTGSVGTQGSNNTGIGKFALNTNTTGYQNTAVGRSALRNNTIGFSNTATGFGALFANTTGQHNTAFGDAALNLNTTGLNNTAIGSGSLQSNLTGDSNSSFGYASLNLNTTGYSNTAIGLYALSANTTGSKNTALGQDTLRELDIIVNDGSGNNTAVGYNTGRGIITGINNTILGANVIGLAADLSNNIIIADGAGNQRINVIANGNVGIGTSSPAGKLDIVGGQLVLDNGDYGGPKGIQFRNVADITTATGGGIYQANNDIVYIQSGTGDAIILRDSAGGDRVSVSGSSWLKLSDNIGAQSFGIRDSSDGTIFYVNSAGNVGIGTTTPTANLQVAQGTAGVGTVSTTATLTTVTGVGTQFLNTFKVGDTITVNAETRIITAITSDTSLATGAWTGSNAGVAYTLAGGTRFSVLGNGNVGIGTTVPGGKLTINTTQELSIPTLGVSSSFFNIVAPILSGASILHGLIAGVLNDGNSYLQVQRIDGIATAYNLLLQPNGGNVGIGTTAPGELLSLGLGGVTKGILSFAGNTSGKIIIQPADVAGTYTLTLPTDDGTLNQVLTTNGSGVLSWTTIASGSSQTPWTSNIDAAGFTLNGNSTVSGNLTLDSTSNATKGFVLINPTGGNVGIGTTTPRTKLELGGDGAILATGTYGSGWTEPNLGVGTRMMWYPRKAAFRAGGVATTQWDDANIGAYSAAMGANTIASNTGSIAMGNITTASGYISTAMGAETIASGWNSTAMGYRTTSSNNYSTAMGNGTTASGDTSTTMGTGTTASGTYSTAMGAATIASGTGSIAMGNSTTASGALSTTMGQNTIANNTYSIATGYYTTASGASSTAMGYYTTANSYVSVALGRYNIGGGTTGSWVDTDSLFEIGIGTSAIAKANALTVLKSGNVGIGTTTPTANLQVAQSTTGVGTVSNLAGGTTVTGVGTQFLNTFKVGDTITIPATTGQTVAISAIASDTSMTTAAITLANSGVAYTLVGGTRFSVLGNGFVGIGNTAPGTMLTVGTATTNTGDITVYGTGTTCVIGNGTGGTSCTSDLRLKENIVDLGSELNNIMALRPVTFNWKDKTRDQILNTGFIAQEVQSIYPNSVSTIYDDYLGIDYTSLVVPAIKAIQELNLNLEGISGTLLTNSGQVITPVTESFITAFFNNLFVKVTTWLADATNGIGNVFANVFNAKEKICVDGECLTKDDVRALLLLAHPDGNSIPTPTPEPTPVPEPIPVPDTSSTDSVPPPSTAPLGSSPTGDAASEPVPEPIPVVEPTLPTPAPETVPAPEQTPEPEPTPVIDIAPVTP
jgi:hypothetical protein